MTCDKENKCIRCSVSQCKYHCNTSNYCTLDTVSIGTHEASASSSSFLHERAARAEAAIMIIEVSLLIFIFRPC